MDPSQRRLTRLAGCFIVLPMALAACGGGSNSSATANAGAVKAEESVLAAVSAAANSAAAAGGSSAAPSAAQAASCTNAVSAVKTALNGYPEVTKVSSDDCEELYVATSIPQSDPLTPNSNKAVAICKAATKVGYVGGVNAIYVNYANGQEASDGTSEDKDIACVPE